MDTRLWRKGRVVVMAALATLVAEMGPLQAADASEQALVDEVIVATTEP